MANKPPFIPHLLGTGFYTGLSPIAPGTVASFFALVATYLLSIWLGTFALVLFLMFWCMATLLTSPSFESFYDEDPSEMVADEWAGQIIPFLTIPFSGSLMQDWWILLTGFLLFRLFDIVKPFGIFSLQKLPGGYGILADDLLAGLYALISLKLIIFLVNI